MQLDDMRNRVSDESLALPVNGGFHKDVLLWCTPATNAKSGIVSFDNGSSAQLDHGVQSKSTITNTAASKWQISARKILACCNMSKEGMGQGVSQALPGQQQSFLCLQQHLVPPLLQSSWQLLPYACRTHVHMHRRQLL